MTRKIKWTRLLILLVCILLFVALQRMFVFVLESYCPTTEKVCVKYEPITISILRSEGEVFVDGKICVEHEEAE